jgi:hypothetical protein
MTGSRTILKPKLEADRLSPSVALTITPGFVIAAMPLSRFLL